MIDSLGPTDRWILDSGASHHMCPHREWFNTYEEVDGGVVSMANNNVYKVKGVGTIQIQLHDRVVRTFEGIRYVPQLGKNLISLLVLDNEGYTYQGGGGVLRVTKGAMTVMKGVRDG